MNISLLSERRRSALVLSLSVLAFCCGREPSMPRAARLTAPRLTEPRLSGFDGWQRCARSRPDGHVVDSFDCKVTNLPSDLVSLAVSECDDNMNTATNTVRTLAYVPQCTDAAVERLETLAKPRSDARLMSDLAGAYYVRAQRKDQPSDFVRSLEAADRAVELAPAMLESRFNRALALEALGFDADAIESWSALRHDAGSQWAKEAEEHLQRLLSKRSRTAAVEWPLAEERLPMVARTGDHKAVRQLVSPYRDAAQLYVEEKVLRAWAEASTAGRASEAAEQLELAKMIASALADLTQDRYLLDAVERIRANREPRVLKQLEDGHRWFALARQNAAGLRSSAALYERAESALAAAGSSLRFGATLGRATELSQRAHYEDALVLFRSIERAANEHQYFHLLARVHAGRGLQFMTQGRDLDALAEYSEAQSIFRRIQNGERIARTQDYITGLFRQIGHEEFTWRAAFQAAQYAADLVDPQARHVHFGESALSAVELGSPSVALRYQNIAVRLLQDELSRSSDESVDKLRRNLGIALRTRAGIYVHLKNRQAAETDLTESSRLMGATHGRKVDDYIPLGFRARQLEAEANKLANTDRRRAIEALSQGIQIASGTYYRSLIASLRLQRAALYRSDGNRIAAAEDLRSAIASLRAEEKSALDGHKDGKQGLDERLWSAYFSRSQDAYHQLIRIYVEDGADAEAFEYAEKARGYEPLHRILRRTDLPKAFRDRIHDDEPLRLADVQQYLPAGTFLLEYSVHDDDRTDVWIVGSTSSERRTLRVGEAIIKEWTRSLQRFASLRNDDRRFDAALEAPYKALLEEPLAIVAKLQGKHTEAKIVIVPDRSMHGLPFAALRNGGRYLIQDHAVSVAGSATLYAFSRIQDRLLSRQEEQSVLLFADPKIDPNLSSMYQLRPLTTARSEAERIRGVYASVARVEPPRTGDRATVPEFLKLATSSTIIHLAVHGVAIPDAPSRSFLLLAPTANDSGAIDAERLSQELQLTRTRLAVLSACSSAGGTPVGPEGLSPLVRPLIVAGVPGVVGTLWNVRDSIATEDLLVRFHQYYRDGHDAGDALRRAQLDRIAHHGVGDPGARGWSAFQMIGYASSPFPASAETRRTQ